MADRAGLELAVECSAVRERRALTQAEAREDLLLGQHLEVLSNVGRQRRRPAIPGRNSSELIETCLVVIDERAVVRR